MALEYDHRGYRLIYNDNADTWGCYQLGVTADTIGKAKRQMDRVLAKRRKLGVDSFPAIIPSRTDYGAVAEFVTVVSKAAAGHANQERVWVTQEVVDRFTSNTKLARKIIDVADLSPDTPEVRQMVERLGELKAERQEAARRFYDYAQSFPPLTEEQLGALDPDDAAE